MHIRIPAEKFHSVAFKMFKIYKYKAILWRTSFAIASQCMKNAKLFPRGTFCA